MAAPETRPGSLGGGTPPVKPKFARSCLPQGLFGDQIVDIEVVVPTVLDDEEKALYQELLNIERFNPRLDLPFS